MATPLQDQANGHVRTEIHNHICTIEFFHPQGNSLPLQILSDLAHAVTNAGNHPEVRVLVLKSAGTKAFCGGASFAELSAITTESEGTRFFNGFAAVFNAMRRCPKLIIARVQGKCVGGGVGLAAAADYAIACEGAEVRLSELAVGIGPLVVGPVVERKIGLSGFSQLAIDAALWRNGDWARRKGLFAELHPTTEGMDESINRLTEFLVHANPDTLREMKKVFWKDTSDWETLLPERAAINGKLVLGQFTKDYIAKFKSKQVK